MDNLELLKSLTFGVNNKISQEQESDIEYIVDTSLRNKRKKSSPPIVKEVVKEVSFDSLNEEDEGADIVYEDEIIEESEEIEEVDKVDTDVLNSSLSESENNQNDYLNDDLVSDFVGESDSVPESEIKVEESVGHISEDLVQNKKEVNKIQRNGNPFKRGPRKKKKSADSVSSIEDKVVDIVKSDPIIEVEDKISDDSFEESLFVPFAEGDNVSEEDEVLNELKSLEDSEFDKLFSDVSFEDESADDFADDSAEELEMETQVNESVEEDTDCVDSENDYEENDAEDSFDDVEDLFADSVGRVEVGTEDNDEFSEDSEDQFDENECVDTESLDKEDGISEEFGEDDFSDTFEEDRIEDKLESDTEISTNSSEDIEQDEVDEDEEDSSEEENSEDEKFKNCIYYKGMSVEDFLRENKDYREAFYVEHFFSKEILNAKIKAGYLLIKKGKYRL